MSDNSDFAVSTSSESTCSPNGGFAGVAHDAHERPGQESPATGSDKANTLALRTNGEERASLGRHPAENDYDPLQSLYAPKKEPAQPTISEDAAQCASEGVLDHIEGRAVNLMHDANAAQRELDRLASSILACQRELERLADSVRSVQREEPAARLPRAAQLPSMLGRAPVGDGLWPPHSLEPDYLAHRDALRGPRTMIKTIFLIVGIFTVPTAYYFLMGGWDTISSALAPEVSSLNSKSIFSPPKPEEETTARDDDAGTPPTGELRTANSFAGQTVAMLQPGTPGAQDSHSITAARALDLQEPSSQQETTIARHGDPGTPAKGEPRTPKSFAGETVAILQSGTPGVGDPQSITAARALDLPKPSTQHETPIARDDDSRTPAKGEPRIAKSAAGETVTMLQPSTPRAQDPPSSPAVRSLGAEQIKLLMKQGEQFIAAGDVVTARIAFRRAAEAGDAKAAVALGATYDPSALAKLGVLGVSGDVAKARSWYERAEKLGSPDGRRLDALADR